MDEFDGGSEVVTPEEKGSKLGMVAIAIGVLGVAVGIAGIVMANLAKKEVLTLEAAMAAQPDKTPDLEKAIAEMDERIVKLGGEFVKLGRQDRQIQDNTQAAFDSVLRDVKANRDGLNALTARMGELVEKLENWQPAAPSRASASAPASGGSTEPGEPVETAEGGVHLVASGDTLSGIAKKYGLTLTQLQAANPTVNPRALQIGQRIVIPQP